MVSEFRHDTVDAGNNKSPCGGCVLDSRNSGLTILPGRDWAFLIKLANDCNKKMLQTLPQIHTRPITSWGPLFALNYTRQG